MHPNQRIQAQRRTAIGHCRGVEFVPGERLDAVIAGSLDGHTLIEVGNAQVKHKEVLTKNHFDKLTGQRIAIETSKAPPYSTSFEYANQLSEAWANVGGKIKVLMSRLEGSNENWRVFLSDKYDDILEIATGTALPVALCAAFSMAQRNNEWPLQPKKIVPSVFHWFLHDGNKVWHETECGGRVTNYNGVLFKKNVNAIPEQTLRDALILNCWELVDLSRAGEQQILNAREPNKRARRRKQQ